MVVQATWRKMVLLLVTTLVAVAMMTASAMPVLAAPQNPDNKSRNSCGKASQQSPFPAQTDNLGDCGISNSRNF